MAFSKQPEVNTYSTKKVPLVHELNSRFGNFLKDTDYINVYFEVTKNRDSKEEYVELMTRPGYAAWSADLQSTSVRKVFYWEAQDKWYVWVDDDIQIVNGTTGAIDATVTGALGTTSGAVGVTEFLYDDGTVKLVFTDGFSLKTIDSANTVVASADADLPAQMLTTIVFLDGYLFFVDAANYDICNSDLNDPLAFTPGNFISAEMLADRVVAISKINNYLVVFGTDSIEYFWDAANASGSPLQRNDTPVKFNGLTSHYSIVHHGNKLYFVGNSEETTPSIFMLEDFKIKEISNSALRKHLASNFTPMGDIHSSIVSVSGHDFLVVTQVGSPSYVIDAQNPELWTRWARAGQSTMPILWAGTSSGSTTFRCVFYISGLQNLFRFDSSITTDAGTAYTMTITTPNEMFDSYNQKVINRLTVVGDRPSVDTNITVSWSDNDYQSFNAGQTVNLNKELPSVYQCGPFRRRAHKLTCSPTVPFRIRHLEVDINLGNS